MTRALALLIVAALAAGAAAHAPAARADADPPSDVLYLQDVYFPYQRPVSQPGRAQLKAVVAAARRAGLPIKVAIVAAPADLGAIPFLFGHPPRYARFLAAELNDNHHKIVLAFMAAGAGVAGATPAQARLVKAARPGGSGSDALAAEAVQVVVAIARASGHPVEVPPLGTEKSSGGGGAPALLPFAPVLVLGLAGLLLMVRGRTLRSRASGE